MGISGLLPLLKSIQCPTELTRYSGETLAVDAYGWLHRGAVSCAVELAQGKPTRKYVDYAMHRVRMLRHFGVTPYMVFDGDFLPSKADTEAARAKRREESRKLGMDLLKGGKPSQAYRELQKAIDVTPEMARDLIEELKQMDIPYVVAPYEADAQMVFLERHGFVNGILSEDSDLLVFGAKRLVTKLDHHGRCVEINRREFCACREISLTDWSDKEFRLMAILSGCDYLRGIGNLGLKTAYRMIRKYRDLQRVVRMLQLDGKHKISENYLAEFRQAELTFLYQRVFCPTKQKLVLLTDLDPDLEGEPMPFIGADLDPELARAIALGDVNPISKKPLTGTGISPPKRRSAGPLATTTATTTTTNNNKSNNNNTSIPSATGPYQHTPQTGKLIESYFKTPSRRIPLGAMDPNCFTVEPRQVRALTQNGLTPRIFPLPRPYVGGNLATDAAPRLQRRRTQPISDLLGFEISGSAPGRRRRTTGPGGDDMAGEAELAAASLPARPPKKARLCEEAAGLGPNAHESFEQSRYFPTSDAAKSKSKEPDLILKSDDSIEEALLSLPDVGGWNSATSAKSSPSVDVFHDETQITVPDSPESKPAASRHEGDSPGSGDDVVLASSPIKAAEAEVVSPRDRSTRPLTLKHFSYTPAIPAAAGGSRLVYGLPTPGSDFHAGPMLTPLQRIGAQALMRARGGTPRTPLTASPGGTKKSNKAAKMGAIQSFPVNAAFVPLPRVDLDEVEALNQPLLGSEDQIIPDSDCENDAHPVEREGDAVDALERPAPAQMNLSRYRYS